MRDDEGKNSEGSGNEEKEMGSKFNLEDWPDLVMYWATAVEGEACYFLDEWRCHLPRGRRLE